MKILYNLDGSIKDIELSHYINQNNNNVDEIQVAIDGLAPSQYVATAYFTLPDGTKNFILLSTTKDLVVPSGTYPGLSFYLTNAQTLYAGVLQMTIEFKRTSNVALFSYHTEFTINVSGGTPSDTMITLSEYNSVVDAINTNRQNSIQSITYNASGKTIEDLYNLTGGKVTCLNLSGITQSGAYIGVIGRAGSVGSYVYYIEIERYASGQRTAQDRWIARDLAGSTLVNDFLTAYNDYYAPYLVNGNVFDYDTATFDDIRNEIGVIPHIIYLKGTGGYSGFYLVKLTDTNDFCAQRIVSASGCFDRWYGHVSDTTTLFKDILANESYHHPFMESDNVLRFITYNGSGKTIADLYDDTITPAGSSAGRVAKMVQMTNITLGGIYQFYLNRTGTSPNYVYNIEIERWGAGQVLSKDRWVGTGIDGSISLNTFLTRYNQYYESYLPQEYYSGSEKTIGDLFNDVFGNVKSIRSIRITDISNGGFFFGIVDVGNIGTINFELEKYSPGSNSTHRFVGLNVPANTLLNDVLSPTGPYSKPYLEIVDGEISDGTNTVSLADLKSAITYLKGQGLIS